MLFDKVKSLFGSISKSDSGTSNKPDDRNQQALNESGCCEGKVHIAYRGIYDDRLYLAKNRTWGEVKYFRPHGLRVFCAGCRHKLYP
jgi:hypothetical protein